jgi:hypothetical protein
MSCGRNIPMYESETTGNYRVTAVKREI